MVSQSRRIKILLKIYFFKIFIQKVPDKQFIEYQQNYSVAQYSKPLENTFYLFNNAFYKWDFENNKWGESETKAVYTYVDYMTGIGYDWNQAANEWQAKHVPVADVKPVADKPKSTKQEEKVIKKKEGWVDVNEEKNTNVYVSGLPLDITDEEFEAMMSKYGIIMKDVVTHKLKIKLYKENDEAKGDGRCCYLMVRFDSIFFPPKRLLAFYFDSLNQ